MMGDNWMADELRGTAVFIESAIAWLARAPTPIDLTPRVIPEFNRAPPPSSEAAPAAGDAVPRPARPAAGRPAGAGTNPHPRGQQ